MSYRLSPGRNALLHDAFLTAIKSGDVQPTSSGKGSRTYDYGGWLRAHGIDPKSGRMTLDGLAFYKQLLDDDRGRKHHRQHP